MTAHSGPAASPLDGGARPLDPVIVAPPPQPTPTRRPAWGWALAVVVSAIAAAPGLTVAQPKKPGTAGTAKPGAPTPADPTPASPPGDAKPGGKPGGKAKVFDFTGLEIGGRLRTPQLLYFLDRASEELERASLERRSFIPEMVRSIDESAL